MPSFLRRQEFRDIELRKDAGSLIKALRDEDFFTGVIVVTGWCFKVRQQANLKVETCN